MLNMCAVIAQNLAKKGVKMAVLDWCEFTLKLDEGQNVSDLVAEVADMFGGFTPSERGFWGYGSGALVLGSGRVAWDEGRRDMGVHVSLPASALARLGAVGLDFATLYCRVRNCGGGFTRLDVAFDSFTVSMALPMAALERRDVVSKCHIPPVGGVSSKSFQVQGTPGCDGWTAYIGSPSSDVRVRFYDKRAEQLGQGKETTHDIWTRCEVQIRHKRADQWADLVYLGESLEGYLRGVVDFRDRSSGDNSTRCEVLSWWSEWIAGAVLMRLGSLRSDSEVAAWEKWLRRTVAPTLAAVFLCKGGDLGFLRELVSDGAARIPVWKQAMITDFLKQVERGDVCVSEV